MKDKKILSIAFLLISTVVFATYAFFVYDFSSGGTAYMLGQVFGAGVIVTIILFISRAKVPYLFRVAVSILIGTAVMAFQNFDELRVAFDMRSAMPLIASLKGPDDITKLLSAYPNNKVVQTFGVVWSNGAATRNRVAELMAAAEPPELNKIKGPVYTLPLTEMPGIAHTFRTAEQNASDLANEVSGLYDDEFAMTEKSLKELGDNSFSRDTLDGLRKRHAREKPFTVKAIKASEALYASMAEQAEFLVAKQGRYEQATDRVIFGDQASVEQWNALVRKVQEAVAGLQAVEAERAEIQRLEAQGFEDIKKM